MEMISIAREDAPPEAEVALARVMKHDGGVSNGEPLEMTLDEEARGESADVTPLAGGFDERIEELLVRKRGALSSISGGGVMGLNASTAVGKNWWWLWKLRGVAFDEGLSYRLDERTTVYRQWDVEEMDWFPGFKEYAVKSEEFEALVALGASVTICSNEHERATECENELLQRTKTELHMASEGLAPAVFAIVYVFDNDEYGRYRTSSTSLDAESRVQLNEAKIGGARASVSVSQFHSYRFSDMLDARNTLGPEHNRSFADRTLYNFAGVLEERIRRLAQLKCLKLNMVPDRIVGVPLMSANAEDPNEWKMTGFAFDTPEGSNDVFEGMPMFVDFDPLFTQRFENDHNYDENCAYAIMIMILLACTRSQFGECYVPVYRKLMGFNIEGSAPSTPERGLLEAVDKIRAQERDTQFKLETFCSLVQSMASSYTGKENIPSILGGLVNDFMRIVRLNTLSSFGANEPVKDWEQPVFEGLLSYFTASTHCPVSLFSPPPTPEMEADREQARLDRKNLMTVVVSQRERWLEQAEQATRAEQEEQTMRT